MADQMTSVPAEPARWPKVVGTISICWGGFWLLCGGCGLAYMAMMPRFLSGVEQQMGEPMPDVMKPGMAQLVLGAVGMISPILLLIAGILTVRRKPAGRTMHLLYACVGIVLTTVSTVIGVQQQLKIMEWVKHNGSSKWAQGGSSAVGLVVMVAILALSVAWPFFCMIWFGAVKRDNRDLDGGSAEFSA